MITRGGGAWRVGVVVLAGGRGERFGDDKLAADLGGRSLLDHTLDALPEHATVVCVGPTRPTSREVTWAREDPPFTGPLAALVAGVRALPEDVRAVALVGADMPRAGRIIPSLTYALVAATAASGSTKDPAAAASVSVDGHQQPLLAVWWRTRLEQRLAAIGDPADRAVRLLLDDIDLVELTVPATAVADVDTAADLAAVRDLLGGEAPPPRPHEESADG